MINGAKFHNAIRRRQGMLEDEIKVAELENRLTDIVSMKCAALVIDILAGALAESIEVKSGEKF